MTIVGHRNRDETAQFFVDALNQMTPPRFRNDVSDANVWHKAMILADYAWVPETEVDQAAAVLIYAKKAEAPLRTFVPRIADTIGSACLMVSGFYDNGLRALGYRKEMLICRGSQAFMLAAELETNRDTQRVFLQSSREFDQWRRYFLRLHRAFRERRIVPPEYLFTPPSIS